MFIEQDDSNRDDGPPFGIRLPEQIDPAPFQSWSRDRLPIAVTADVKRNLLEASGLADVAGAIEQVAAELDALERDRRAGRLESLELMDRYLTAWFAIKEIGLRIEAAESREQS